MTEEYQRAFSMAMQAASIDFEAALMGLISGHRNKIRELEKYAAKKDRAFLIALSLTEKGARLDKDGFMAEKMIESVCRDNMSPVEKRTVERIEGKTND